MHDDVQVHERSIAIRAVDGVPLGAHLFTPAGPVRAAVVVLGATATPQRYYRSFARWLAARGFGVLTFDYRGIGASRRGSLRGDPATLRDWGERDVTAAVAALGELVPDVPVLALGHSFGGQALGLSDVGERLAGVVTFGAQLGWYGHWAGTARWRMWAIWSVVVPVATSIFGYLPRWTGIGEDLPAGVAREWARWCRSRRYLVDHVPEAAERLAALGCPVHVVGASDDDYAPRPAVDAYVATLPTQRTTRTWLVPASIGVRRIGHFGFFRPSLREALWEDVARWLDARAVDARGQARRAG